MINREQRIELLKHKSLDEELLNLDRDFDMLVKRRNNTKKQLIDAICKDREISGDSIIKLDKSYYKVEKISLSMYEDWEHEKRPKKLRHYSLRGSLKHISHMGSINKLVTLSTISYELMIENLKVVGYENDGVYYFYDDVDMFSDADNYRVTRII